MCQKTKPFLLFDTIFCDVILQLDSIKLYDFWNFNGYYFTTPLPWQGADGHTTTS